MLANQQCWLQPRLPTHPPGTLAKYRQLAGTVPLVLNRRPRDEPCLQGMRQRSSIQPLAGLCTEPAAAEAGEVCGAA